MKKLFILLAVAVAMLAFAGSAFASTQHSTAGIHLYRPFPNGIDPNNPQHALQEIQGRAAWDRSYATTIAQQAGRPSYNPSEYRAAGYASHAPAGTTNSAVTGYGAIVPVTDHDGSQNVKVFEMINLVSQKTVYLMVRCGNPRLKPSVSVVVIPWKPFSKGTVIRFNRRVSKPVSITCPSGQTVSGTLTTTVSGFARASTWGKVQGSLNLALREKIQLQVKSWVSLHCGPAPAQPVTPSAPCSNITIVNSPGAQVCVVYITITCSNAVVTFSGSDSTALTSQVQQYINNNCPGTVIPPPSSQPQCPSGYVWDDTVHGCLKSKDASQLPPPNPGGSGGSGGSDPGTGDGGNVPPPSAVVHNRLIQQHQRAAMSRLMVRYAWIYRQL